MSRKALDGRGIGAGDGQEVPVAVDPCNYCDRVTMFLLVLPPTSTNVDNYSYYKSMFRV